MGLLASTALLKHWQVGRRPILILGHGRSGTTWLGKMISAARRVLYYFEPLHPSKMGDENLANWFYYARPGETVRALESAFDPIFAGLPSLARAWGRKGWHRWLPGYRVAVKDVAGLMLAEWLHERYQPLVLFVVRHPCAVILSELRQGTPPNRSLRVMLQQSALMQDHLAQYASTLDSAQGDVASLAAVWAARHRVVANGLAKHPEWKVIYYEALCADPVGHFKQLFYDLGLRWSNAMNELVARHSSVDVPGLYSGRRISVKQLEMWKQEMTSADADSVRQITGALEVPFYASDDLWTTAHFQK